MRSPHSEKVQRFWSLVFADSPYTVLSADEFVAADCTGGQISANLPALAGVVGLSFTFSKTDASSNAYVLDGSGGETINGQLTFSLLGQSDTVTVFATPTGWRITNFTPGTILVPNDAVEFMILDRSAADILNAATLALAEVNAAAQAASFGLVGYGRFVVTIDLTTVGAATTLFVGARQSGKAAPVVGTVADWSYYAIDNIDRSTGISATQPYQINIPVNGVRRYTRSFQTWGGFGAPVIWCNGAGARGIVYAQRFAGG